MPLVKKTLQDGILGLLTQMRERTEVSDEEFAGRLATMIDTCIKRATITVPVGSPAAQTGATTATATATAEIS